MQCLPDSKLLIVLSQQAQSGTQAISECAGFRFLVAERSTRRLGCNENCVNRVNCYYADHDKQAKLRPGTSVRRSAIMGASAVGRGCSPGSSVGGGQAESDCLPNFRTLRPDHYCGAAGSSLDGCISGPFHLSMPADADRQPIRLANLERHFVRGHVERPRARTMVSRLASWDDGLDLEEETEASMQACVVSHFGCGIITWTLPYLFQTPPGWSLLARGPANWPFDGVSPLEGIVETDQAASTFTMNWKITRPDFTVRFDRGDPICMIVRAAAGGVGGVRAEVPQHRRLRLIAAALLGLAEKPDEFPEEDRKGRPQRNRARLAKKLLPGRGTWIRSGFKSMSRAFRSRSSSRQKNNAWLCRHELGVAGDRRVCWMLSSVRRR